MSSSILYQNEDKTAILLDIPRSIELAQGTPKEPCLRRLISCEPLEKPFPSLEPKSAKAKAKFGDTPIKSLLLQKHIQFCLEEVKKQHAGPWCLPRAVLSEFDGVDEEPPSKKQKAEYPGLDNTSVRSDEISLDFSITKTNPNHTTIIPVSEIPELYQNQSRKTAILRHTNMDTSRTSSIYIPPNSTLINRLIKTPDSFHLPENNKFSPNSFNLIILDPPWPNRSVQRKNNYSISSSTSTIQTLLTSIPIPSLLASNSIVGLWITNKPAFHTLILDPGGIFEQWGVKLIEEWVWVKITKDGDPMCDLNGSWRKPYEILLVGRKIPHDYDLEKDETEETGKGITRRVIFAIPDIHSRKPNLKELFEMSGLLQSSVEYEAMEIFARNLTAGWWAWGNEVMKFQAGEYWVEDLGERDL